MSARPTANETIDSLTGWEEIAIEQSSGKTLEMFQAKDRPNNVQMMRCLAGVLLWREKLAGGDLAAKYHASYSEVMGMSQSAVNDLFGEEPDDLVPGEPDSEVGKDSSLQTDEPGAKLNSVSLPESHPTSTPV